MKHRFLGLGILAVMAWSLTALAADKNTKVDPKKEVNSDNVNPGDYTGKLLTTPTSGGDFTVRMEYKHPDPKHMPKNYNNNNNINHQQQLLMQAQNQLAQARTPQQAQQAMTRMQQAQNNLQNAMMTAQAKANANIKMITDHVDIDFHLSPTAIVRNMNPPQAFDEKGNVKKYTAEELKALKGKYPNLVGYETDISTLQPNQVVKVTMKKRPTTTPPKKPVDTTAKPVETPKPEGGAKEDVAAEKGEKPVDPIKEPGQATSKTWVTLVIIQADPDQPVDNKPNPKKNK